jgi:aryl-alcohol dehydrogenase-like predicted oxidoreductase
MFHPAALPRVKLGSTGREVTRLGLGGEGVLRTFGYEAEAGAVIGAALAGGITYLESARAYQGSERYYGDALSPARRSELFLASKAHDRTKRGARAMLETTLAAMRLDYLDLWQFHDVREWSEVDELEAPDGAYAAFVEAKAEGLVRFIGVTGHAAPEVLRSAFERVAFDTVLLPINPAEGAVGDGFERSVVPAARARGMGVVGMKVLARGLLLDPRVGIAAADAIAYALGADVDTIVVGCDDVAQVQTNVAAALHGPMPQAARRELEERVRPWAHQLRYYRQPATA